MRIGVDVGGTNTDAVLLNGSSVLGWCKSATETDIGSSVLTSVGRLLDDCDCDPSSVSDVMVGTTQFTNGLLERKGLLEVAVLRLASPSGHSVPPKIGWPGPLSAAIGDHVFLLPGGYEFDGREIAPLDEAGTRRAAREIRRRGLRTAAISSVFAPLNAAMEKRAAAILSTEVPGISVTLSSHMGRIGLYERENSAILNASLAGLSRRVTESLHGALSELGVRARLHISQNDGTLMKSECVRNHPIFTLASGPTNSMRGAALLSGLREAVVVDIGGTTCDLGVLRKGFPRESARDVEFAGVCTNFRMPDILSIAVGGGSIVHGTELPRPGASLDSGGISIGPQSVGSRLAHKALIFGGDTLTATDVAVAANRELNIGDRSRVETIPGELVERLESKIHRLVENALLKMETGAEALPIVLVGGGSVLIRRPLLGDEHPIRPNFAPVANAVGAAIAQVGGEVDRVYSYRKTPRDQALRDARRCAVGRVVQAGGVRDAVRFVELEEIPLNYLPGEAVRIRAKAVSDLANPTEH